MALRLPGDIAYREDDWDLAAELVFAFGSKEGLFKKIIERHLAEQGDIAVTAFGKPTARAIATDCLCEIGC